MDLWAFGISQAPAGLNLSSRRFWLLTPREFTALKVRFEAAHGIKSKPTWKHRRAEALQSPRVVHATDKDEAIRMMNANRCQPKGERRRRRNEHHGG